MSWRDIKRGDLVRLNPQKGPIVKKYKHLAEVDEWAGKTGIVYDLGATTAWVMVDGRERSVYRDFLERVE